MALFILSIVGLLATAALIWCLLGFSRALKEKPKVISLLVRMEINDANMRQRKASARLLSQSSSQTLNHKPRPAWVAAGMRKRHG